MSRENIFNTLLGLGTVGVFGWILWYFISNLQEADANVKAGILGLFGLLLTAILTNYFAKRREINARHFAEKREAYRKIIELVFDISLSTKSGKSISEKTLITKMTEFKRELLIWGGSDVIQKWNDFEMKSQDTMDDPNEIIILMEHILRALRKDLGHDDQLLKFGHLVGLMIKAEDKNIILKDEK